MNKKQRLMYLQNRYNMLKERPKCLKAPGVLHKLERQIRNLEKEIGNE